jgi:hypothetical protein
LVITLVRLDDLDVAALVTGFSQYSTQGEKDALQALLDRVRIVTAR